MFKYLFWGIVLYLVIRFIVNFVIPVFRATRQMRNQVKDFQQRMEEERNAQSNFQETQASPKTPVNKEDYIDFEEIK